MVSDILLKFQEFLIKEKRIPEKNAPYYALWVNKFFSFAGAVVEEKIDNALKQFLTELDIQKAESGNLLFVRGQLPFL